MLGVDTHGYSGCKATRWCEVDISLKVVCRRSAQAVAGGVLVASLLILRGEAPSGAAVCGTKGNYFVGYDTNRSETSLLGTSANLQSKYGTMCTSGGTHTVSAWTMLHSGEGCCQYAQAGYIRFQNWALNRHFAESFSLLPETYQQRIYTEVSPTDPTPRYKTYFTNSRVQMRVNDTVIQTTNFDPTAQWSKPFAAAYRGEASYKQTQMPQLARFDEILNYVNGAWTTSVGSTQAFNDNPTGWYRGSLQLGSSNPPSPYFVIGNL